MAILKGVDVAIEVDGKALREYDCDEEEDGTAGDTVTKYIEVTPGSNFAVFCRWAANFIAGLKVETLNFGPVLDGNRYGSWMPRSDALTSFIPGERIYENGRWTLRRFRFSEIVTDENATTSPERAALLKESASKLGTITIEVHRVRSCFPQEPLAFHSKGIDPSQPLPEKALKGKAISHRHRYLHHPRF